jgi:hypothetical protein
MPTSGENSSPQVLRSPKIEKSPPQKIRLPGSVVSMKLIGSSAMNCPRQTMFEV